VSGERCFERESDVIVTLLQRARAVCRRLMNVRCMRTRTQTQLTPSSPFSTPRLARRGWRKRWLRAASEQRIANGKVIIAAINHLPNPILPFIYQHSHACKLSVSVRTCGLPLAAQPREMVMCTNCGPPARMYMQSSVCA
jgi:hypothetical protein